MTTKLLKPKCATNPIVFFDIDIGKEYAGRMVIELRADVVPKTAENFRALCTGEYGIGTFGKPLHYKGTRFHKVTRVFVAQSGDIVNNDGTGGESIYGPIFDDENFELMHDEGVVSMANFGKPNTNNSQFVITSIACANLDGTNVVVGRILRGFGIIGFMEQNTCDSGIPTSVIEIRDCGELNINEDWGITQSDKLPLYPQDWDVNKHNFKFEEFTTILNQIRNDGNVAFKNQQYYHARSKYRKAIRYLDTFRGYYDRLTFNESSIKFDEQNGKSDKLREFDAISVLNHVNMAAVELKLGQYENALHSANEAVRLNSKNAKAFYRRGQTHIGLSNYEEAITDFRRALEMLPNDKLIQTELNHAIKQQNSYNRRQRIALKSLFQ